MRRLSLFFISVTACLFIATIAQALTMGYGQRDVAKAGAGCVGGWISEHGNTAYFRGDTELLNVQLASLAAEIAAHPHVKVVLHAGTKHVDNPEEQPVTGFGDQDSKQLANSNQLAIDWSVRRYCPFDDVLSGRCKCDRRIVVVDVWICDKIQLDALSAPSGLSLESGREIEKFVEEHANRK